MGTAEKPDLNRLLQLQKLLLQFRAIKRIVYLPGGHEAESDTDHSYSLAMTAWFLAQYFPQLDTDKLIRLALVHDLVEVHAGDTFAYADSETLAGKRAREAKALQQLAQDWPDFPEVISLIHDYEERETEEVRFIYALDKLMPAMMVYLDDGYAWKKEGITLQMLQKTKRDKIVLSPEINVYYEQLLDLLANDKKLFANV